MNYLSCLFRYTASVALNRRGTVVQTIQNCKEAIGNC